MDSFLIVVVYNLATQTETNSHHLEAYEKCRILRAQSKPNMNQNLHFNVTPNQLCTD